MPFYNGVANSFADLRTALFTACVAEGWTLTSDILTKGSAAVRIENNTVSTITKEVGLIITGGLGVSGGVLTSPSPNTPRMGAVSSNVNLPSWPMTYEIHIHTNPDEVYLKAIYNIDSYYWLAFGLSDSPGLLSTGQWVAANAIVRQTVAGGGVNITVTSGAGSASAHSSCGIFWQTFQQPTAAAYFNEAAIASGLDGFTWAGNPVAGGDTNPGCFNSIISATTLLAVLPNAWNSESPLVPILPLQWRASGKVSIVANLKHARYCRVDNYSPGQVIPLGSDRWQVQPFYRKNTIQRNGGSNIDHTGTFGWAIRYDGP